ncbi:MAG: SpoIIE family protein phosphatase [Cytophagales bacterium]|nr:SpoIIE family protein phosphatase [Cytophagales bacterium]
MAQRSAFHYALFGLAFGLFFPLGSWFFDAWVKELDMGLAVVYELHRVNPLHYIIDSAPVVLAFAFGMAGAKQDRVKYYYEHLAEEVQEKTKELRGSNQELQQINEEIAVQSEQLSKAMNQLESSINYAQRIQTSILEKESFFKEKFSDAFILFYPRNVVSGDFYFYTEKDEKQVVAAVDCTGHGVPGAFMSLIGNELLREIINIAGVTEPDFILQLLHKNVVKTLRQHESSVNDGMDLSLCVIDPINRRVEVAGAKNPILYTSGQELIMIKGSAYSIGGIQKRGRLVFDKHTLPYERGMRIYLFTDGYQDQFGGAQNKKLMLKRLREELEKRRNENLTKQRAALEDLFYSWKRSYPQTDDVLVMAIEL